MFWCNSNDPIFDLFKFLGKINLHISTLLYFKFIDKDFKKIVAVTKLKELKRYVKKILLNYKKRKTYNQR